MKNSNRQRTRILRRLLVPPSQHLSFVGQCVTFGWDGLTLDLAFPQFMGSSLAINFVGKDVYVIYG